MTEIAQCSVCNFTVHFFSVQELSDISPVPWLKTVLMVKI